MDISKSKTLPPSIQLEKFTQARMTDILQLKENLVDSSIINEKKALERHLRRRTTSHNPRKPIYLKQKHKEKRSSKPTGNTCRSQRRRPTVMRKEREGFLPLSAQGGRATWLETHHWHAKRFHMEDLWGYRLPTINNDKGHRAIARAISTQCILHDASYSVCIELKGAAEDIKLLLAQMMDPLDMAMQNPDVLSGRKEGQSFLYEQGQFPMSCLAPFEFLWRPSRNLDQDKESSHSQLWIWVHPAGFQECHDAIKGTLEITEAPWSKVEMKTLEMHKFKLRGKKCSEVLSKVLVPFLQDSSVSTRKKMPNFVQANGKLSFNEVNSDEREAKLEDGIALGLHVMDPRGKKGSLKVAPSSANNMSSETLEVPLWEIPCTSMIWDSKVRAHSTTRISAPPDHDLFKSVANESPTETSGSSQYDTSVWLPVLLIRKQPLVTSSDLGGWDLIFPRGWSRPMLHSLWFSGARVVGIEGWNRWALEAAHPLFPQDFPDTPAGQRWWLRFQKNSEFKYSQKRPRHRGVKISKESSIGCFGPEWWRMFSKGCSTGSVEQLETSRSFSFSVVRATHYAEAFVPKFSEDVHWRVKSGKEIPPPGFAWVPKAVDFLADISLPSLQVALPTCLFVALEMIGKGRPRPGNLVFTPSKKDLQQYASALKNQKRNVDITKESNIQFSKESTSADSIETNNSHLIGYVTSGDYSYTRGIGFSMAVCEVTSVNKLLLQAAITCKSKKTIVFVQNPSVNSEMRPALLHVQ